ATTPKTVIPFFNGGRDKYPQRVGGWLGPNGDENPLPNAYQAFIWHLFIEQETGAQALGAMWNATASMLDADPPNSVFPFKTHFKDFILRNLNDDSLDSAGLPKYDSIDPSFPAKTSIPLGKDHENLGSVQVGAPTMGTVNLFHLSAHYADVG